MRNDARLSDRRLFRSIDQVKANGGPTGFLLVSEIDGRFRVGLESCRFEAKRTFSR
jgi:hypothetical protein